MEYTKQRILTAVRVILFLFFCANRQSNRQQKFRLRLYLHPASCSRDLFFQIHKPAPGGDVSLRLSAVVGDMQGDGSSCLLRYHAHSRCVRMTGGVDTGFPHDRKKDFEQLRLRRKLAVYFHTDAGNLCIPDKLRHIVPGIDVFLTQYLNGTAKLLDSGGVFFGSGVLPQNLPYGGNSHIHLIVQPRFQVQDFLFSCHFQYIVRQDLQLTVHLFQFP